MFRVEVPPPGISSPSRIHHCQQLSDHTVFYRDFHFSLVIIRTVGRLHLGMLLCQLKKIHLLTINQIFIKETPQNHLSISLQHVTAPKRLFQRLRHMSFISLPAVYNNNKKIVTDIKQCNTEREDITE